jgi:hypothetical protein
MEGPNVTPSDAEKKAVQKAFQDAARDLAAERGAPEPTPEYVGWKTEKGSGQSPWRAFASRFDKPRSLNRDKEELAILERKLERRIAERSRVPDHNFDAYLAGIDRLEATVDRLRQRIPDHRSYEGSIYSGGGYRSDTDCVTCGSEIEPPVTAYESGGRCIRCAYFFSPEGAEEAAKERANQTEDE